MDNITHTLIGLVIGEAALHIYARALKNPEAIENVLKKSRLQFWTVSALGNNFPDLDFLYANQFVSGGGPIGYLLHHRGHTHTFVMALPQAAILMFGLWTYMKRGARFLTKGEWQWLMIIALLGPFFHILADSFNNYGIHPLWPFNNRWFYGDSIFIVEPWLWIALSPHLFHRSKSKVTKALFALFPLIAIGFLFGQNHVPPVFGIAGIAYFSLIMIAPKIRSRLTTSHALNALSILFTFVIVFSFSTASILLRSKLASLLQSKSMSLSPSPGNPFCWNVLSMSITQDDDYHLRKGSYSLAPKLISHKDCAFRITIDANDIGETQDGNGTEPYWFASFSGTLSELKDLYSSSCEFRGFMGFARFPMWQNAEQSPELSRNQRVINASDFRFSGNPSDGFTSVDINKDEVQCDFIGAPWIPPLHDNISFQ